MATTTTNYQCPACTGPMHFSPTTGKLECDYCGSSYSVAEIEALFAEKNAQAEKAAADQQPDEAQQWGAEPGMRAYSCPSCGAVILCDETTAATSCPYCGNPTVVPSQVGDTLKPDFVIPFMLEKEAAVAALKKHYKGKIFLPKAFTEHNHIEKVSGIYVPFWLYDGEAGGSMTFDATKVHTTRTAKTETTVTDHFKVLRAGSLDVAKVPVDASSKMPDDYMDALEPYDYAQLKPFAAAYMPGFLADKYDVTADVCEQRAAQRAQASAEQAMQRTVIGYASSIPTSRNISFRRQKVHYAMLPVWLLSTKWKDKNYLFTMNGQTGKLVGDLPVDKGKFWGLFGLITVGLSALLLLLGLASTLAQLIA